MPLRSIPGGPIPDSPRTIRFSDMPEEAPVKWIGGGIMPDDGFTLIYGPGGTGKGMVAVAVCDMLAQEGYPPLVLDWERHPSEWRTRVMGMAKRSASLISYMRRDWLELDMQYSKAVIAEAVDESEARAIIIDSYFFAAPSGGKKADPEREQAIAFAKIVIDLGLPTLLLSHVSKKEANNPKMPYGSVFVVNAARAGWSIQRESVPGEPLEVRLTHRKVNDGTHQMDKVIGFQFADGAPVGYEIKDAAASLIDAIIAAIGIAGVPLRWDEIAVELARQGMRFNRESVRITCYIYSKEGGARTQRLERIEGNFGTKFRALRR